MSMTTANRNNLSPDSMFGEINTRIAGHLIQFGRIGYVTDRTKIKGKMKPRSYKGIMIGYAEDHSPDTYILFNPRTRKTFRSRDVKWADFHRPFPHEDLDLYRTGEDNIDTSLHLLIPIYRNPPYYWIREEVMLMKMRIMIRMIMLVVLKQPKMKTTLHMMMNT